MSHIKSLQQKGYRITDTRRTILQLFEQSSQPLSAPDILKLLNKVGIHVNKSTVYRELDFLLAEHIIKIVQLNTKKLFYELKDQDHHHHLVCNNCGTIESIELEKEAKLLNEASQKTNFQIKEHTLEFFGICNNCQ